MLVESKHQEPTALDLKQSSEFARSSGTGFSAFYIMKSRDIPWIVMFTFTGLLTLVTTIGCIPLNSKAAGWMSQAGEDSRSYSHLGGGSKFAKASYASTPPRSTYPLSSGNSSNKTLAAILFLTVFGIGATALFVILCSKITKKEQYDSVKGAIY